MQLGRFTASEFNQRFSIGTPVRFSPVLDEPAFEETTTRSAAWALGHGAVDIAVEGRELGDPCPTCDGAGKIAPVSRLGRSGLFVQGAWTDCPDCSTDGGND